MKAAQKQRLLRQIMDFAWKKFHRGHMNSTVLFRVVNALDMPTPKEWRVNDASS